MKGICKVILRVMSISIMFRSFTYIQAYIQFLFSPCFKDTPTETLTVVYLAISFISTIVFGILLWVFSDRISTLMIKDDQLINISSEGLLRTSIIVIGVIFLVNSFPSLVGNIYEFISAQNLLKSQGSTSVYNGFLQVKSAIITNLLKIAVAIFMITGYRIIIKLSTFFGRYAKKEDFIDDSDNVS